MPRIVIIDLNVVLAHSHADSCHEAACQVGVKAFGELVARSGCSTAERRMRAVPWRTEYRSTSPLERLFVAPVGQEASVRPRRGISYDVCRRPPAVALVMGFKARV